MPFTDRPLPEVFQVTPIVPLKHGRGNPPRKKKGAVAKLTRDVKAGILEGAIAHGSDGEGLGGLTGYFEMCAAKYPKVYMHLLGKLMPVQLHAEGLPGPSITSVSIISVPTNTYLSVADMQRLQDGAMPTIEHVPQEITSEPVPEHVPEPASDRLAVLEAELNGLTYDELLARARQCGLVANVE